MYLTIAGDVGADLLSIVVQYPIVRDAHRVEDNEAIGELYFILVDHLMRDEEPLPAAEPIETPSMNQETEAEKKLLEDAQHEEEMPEMDVLVSDSDDEDEGEKESVD
jgi:hypothetical protein